MSSHELLQHQKVSLIIQRAKNVMPEGNLKTIQARQANKFGTSWREKSQPPFKIHIENKVYQTNVIENKKRETFSFE